MLVYLKNLFHKLDKKPNNPNIFIDDLNISVSPINHKFFLDGIELAKELKQFGQARYRLDPNNNILITIDHCKFYIHTTEELLILKEIFLQGVYNFFYNKPTVVWDIGMNVGIASLFFAGKPFIQKVYSYEPFEETYQKACLNINLNPKNSNKIKSFNFGIAQQDKTLTVDYTPEWMGSMSIYNLPSPKILNINPLLVRKEKIRLKNASTVLREIKKENKGYAIMAKIDCEGAEFEIIKCLYENNLLNDVTGFIIELHKKNPEYIINFLSNSKFTIFSNSTANEKIGMIYASRN